MTILNASPQLLTSADIFQKHSLILTPFEQTNGLILSQSASENTWCFADLFAFNAGDISQAQSYCYDLEGVFQCSRRSLIKLLTYEFASELDVIESILERDSLR